MSFKLINHPELESHIERMLQGLAYYLAYTDCVYGKGVSEREFAVEACNILRRDLGRQEYFVLLEFSYKKIPSTADSTWEADLIIARRGKDSNGILKKDPAPEDIQCVIEFKLSKDTNGNIFKDTKKLRTISANIDRLAIVLFLKPNDKIREILTNQSIVEVELKKKPKDDKKNKTRKIVNYTAKTKEVDLWEKEKAMKTGGKQQLTKTTMAKVLRVTKAYPSTFSANPYMAMCVAVLDSDFSMAVSDSCH